MKNNLIVKRIVMKSFAILLITMLTGSILLAHETEGQGLDNVMVSLQLENTRVKKVLEELQERTEFNFLYNEKDIRSLDKISVQASSGNLEDVLYEISRQTGLSFRRVNENIAVRLKEKQEGVVENAKTLFDKKITGKVTDAETGEPLIGATVQVKGTTIGAVTNINGEYSIEIPDDAEILVISYLGYGTEEISINSKSILNIQLIKNLAQLDEVVVTALDMRDSKRKLGYSLAQLNGREVSTVKNTNLISSLQSKVSGVNVTSVNTGMGGSQRIIIRGIASISRDNQPLWIIDGVPVTSSAYGNTSAGGGVSYGDPLSGIDPDNIESLTVLKSNAAAALYGSKAANGVILVNTKSGKGAEGFGIELNSSTSFHEPRDFSDWQYEYGQGSEGKIPASQDEALSYGNQSWGAKINEQSSGVQFDGKERPYKAFPGNFEKYYRTGFTHSHSLGITGGGENHHFRVSASHNDGKDIVPNGEYQRNTIGVNASTNLNFLEIDFRINYFNEIGKNRTRIGGNYQNPHLGFFSIPTSLDANTIKPGYYDDFMESEMTFGSHPSQTNPFFVANKIKRHDDKNNLIGSLNIKIPFYNGFYVKSRILQNYISFRNQEGFGSGIAWNPRGGGINEDWNNRLQSNYEAMLGFNKTLNNLTINTFAGANMLYIVNRGVRVSGNPFVNPGIYSINNLENRNVSSQFSEEQTNSIFGSMQLGWFDRIYLTLTGRNDWFSTLPKVNNSLFYPSVSLSILPKDWLLKGEAFSINQTRMSYARVSGATSPYQLDMGYSLDTENYGGNPIQRISTGRIPNKDLKPFISTEYELGLNLGFFSDLLTLDLVYYEKNIENDIVATSVSPTTGFGSAILNVGDVENKGFETSLTGLVVNKKDFSVRFTGNFSYNMNNVVTLGDAVETIALQRAKYSNSAYIHIDEGEPYGVIRGTTLMRDDQGNLVYDENGYNIIDPESKVIGYGVYDKFFGLSFNVNYKSFSFLPCLMENLELISSLKPVNWRLEMENTK